MSHHYLSQNLTQDQLADIVVSGGKNFASAAQNLAAATDVAAILWVDTTLSGTGNPLSFGLQGLHNDAHVSVLGIEYYYVLPQGSRARSLTIIQIERGLGVEQYLLEKPVSEEDALTIARLATSGLLPALGARWEG